MTLAATSIMEIRYTATSGNVNGGGFNPANANFLTNGTVLLGTGNSPTIASVSYAFVAGDVNAKVFIPVQTGVTYAGWFNIVSVATGVATLQAAIGQGVLTSNNYFFTQKSAGITATDSPTGVTFGVDYSQQDAAIISPTDLVSVGSSSTMTSVAALFTPVMVGNFLHLNNAGTGGFGTVGWYEIVSYNSTSSVVTDRTTNGGTAMASGQGKIGGAMSLNSSDNTLFAIGTNTSTAAFRWFVKYNASSYTLSASSTVAAGSSTWPSIIEGYNASRGDRPKPGGNIPLISTGGAVLTGGSACVAISIACTGTATKLFTITRAINCASYNTSPTAGRDAFGTSSSTLIGCEAVSVRGQGTTAGAGVSLQVIGCWFHDSDKGILTTTGRLLVLDSIFTGNVTAGVHVNGANASIIVMGCTFDGATNKLGTDLLLATGVLNVISRNNIFSGATTGVSAADAGSTNLSNFCNYYNNTTDVSTSSTWQLGPNDLALNPGYASVAQITGTTATTSNSGNTLVDSGKTFITSGVVAGRDYVYVSSSSGTTGVYTILSVDGETQVTLGQAPGASSGNVTYEITTGRNYGIGTNMKNVGSPGVLPGSLTTGHRDIGAAQHADVATISGAYALFG